MISDIAQADKQITMGKNFLAIVGTGLNQYLPEHKLVFLDWET
jgi:hypothetical protein